MYFNHQLHYSVSSTASSVRERLFFFLDLFYFQSIENSVDNFVGTERETERENTSKTKAVLRRFSDSLVWISCWNGGNPTHFVLPIASFQGKVCFLFIFCTSKVVKYWRAYDEYSNRHAPDYIFKNGIATRYGGNIKDLSWFPSIPPRIPRPLRGRARGRGEGEGESHNRESSSSFWSHLLPLLGDVSELLLDGVAINVDEAEGFGGGSGESAPFGWIPSAGGVPHAVQAGSLDPFNGLLDGVETAQKSRVGLSEGDVQQLFVVVLVLNHFKVSRGWSEENHFGWSKVA